ncbi:acetyltransferase [Nitrospira sp.]|nr:acetyltransferase [Nitrospira sp.]
MNQNPAYAGFQIGDWTYGSPTVPRCLDGATLRIGRFCAIASGVTILTGLEHRTDWISTYHFHLLGETGRDLPYASRTKGDVVIGHDVWVANDVLILSGVSIGNGAVVAARSVVTKDVPAYAIVAGVPAKVVRYRFDPPTVEALQAIAWWNWPIERIREAAPLLMSSDVKALLRQYGTVQ